MSEKSPFDPMAYFRDMVAEWEKITNDVGASITGTSEFTKVMHQASNAQLGARKAMQDMMAKTLAAANMPSRSELEAIGERLGAMEGQLARIEALLSGTRVPGTETPPPPRRTKRPPTAA
jgi:polyhydroxyalkanoate synthesis regulator phasin